jgi:hypothetical protein
MAASCELSEGNPAVACSCQPRDPPDDTDAFGPIKAEGGKGFLPGIQLAENEAEAHDVGAGALKQADCGGGAATGGDDVIDEERSLSGHSFHE